MSVAQAPDVREVHARVVEDRVQQLRQQLRVPRMVRGDDAPLLESAGGIGPEVHELVKQDAVAAEPLSEPPIVELDRDGKILKQWGEKLFAWPHGIRVDRFGYLWITDGQARNGIGQQVFKYTLDGKLLMTLGTKGVRGEGPDTFAGPCDVAVAANGDIFVADGHVNARIVKFDKDGTFIKAWGKKGAGPGEFNLPHTIVIDSRGRVLVGDRSNNRIQIFDQDGSFIDQWTQFGTPSGMFITPDDTLYVVDYNVKKGVFIGNAKDGSVKYKLDDAVAEGVAVDRDGNIYVGETVPGTTLTGIPGGHIVRKFEKLR